MYKVLLFKFRRHLCKGSINVVVQSKTFSVSLTEYVTIYFTKPSCKHLYYELHMIICTLKNKSSTKLNVNKLYIRIRCEKVLKMRQYLVFTIITVEILVQNL